MIYAVAALIVIAAVGAAVPPLRQRGRQLAADLKIINADTADVMSSATYQRFAVRRDRWVATAGSYVGNTTMSCMITAKLDTLTWHYHPGQPVCAEASFEDTVAALFPAPPAKR